jgi:hypothetical protein
MRFMVFSRNGKAQPFRKVRREAAGRFSVTTS